MGFHVGDRIDKNINSIDIIMLKKFKWNSKSNSLENT